METSLKAWEPQASRKHVKAYLKDMNKGIRQFDSMGNVEMVDTLTDEKEIFLTFRKKHKKPLFSFL